MQYQNMKIQVNIGLQRTILCMNDLDYMALITKCTHLVVDILHSEQSEAKNYYDNMLIKLTNMGPFGS